MEGIRGTAGARTRRPQLLVVLMLLQVVLLLVVVAADPLASHTFVPPFSEVQVDGVRLVSTYVDGVDWDHVHVCGYGRLVESTDRCGVYRYRYASSAALWLWRVMPVCWLIPHTTDSINTNTQYSNNREWTSGGVALVNQNFVRCVITRVLSMKSTD